MCDAWVRVLVDQFWAERNKWPDNLAATSSSAAKEYFVAAVRLRPKILRLTACAFLHITYDLPRVLANEWPERGIWANLPEQLAEGAFVALEPVFPRVAAVTAKNRRIFGWPSFGLRLIPNLLVEAASCWVFRLRLAAWSHARVLNHSPNRANVEMRMMRAITAAIQHVQNLKPWRATLLSPPNAAVYAAQIGMIAALNRFEISVTLAMAFALLITVVLALIEFRRRISEQIDFLDEFGNRLLEYLAVAVDEKSDISLDNFLKSRDPGSR